MCRPKKSEESPFPALIPHLSQMFLLPLLSLGPPCGYHSCSLEACVRSTEEHQSHPQLQSHSIISDLQYQVFLLVSKHPLHNLFPWISNFLWPLGLQTSEICLAPQKLLLFKTCLQNHQCWMHKRQNKEMVKK